MEVIGTTAFALAQGTLAILIEKGVITYSEAYDMLDEAIEAHESMNDPVQSGVARMLRLVRQATQEREANQSKSLT